MSDEKLDIILNYVQKIEKNMNEHFGQVHSKIDSLQKQVANNTEKLNELNEIQKKIKIINYKVSDHDIHVKLTKEKVESLERKLMD